MSPCITPLLTGNGLEITSCPSVLGTLVSLNNKPIFYDTLYCELSPIQPNPPPTPTDSLLLSPTTINRDLFPEQTEKNKKQYN